MSKHSKSKLYKKKERQIKQNQVPAKVQAQLIQKIRTDIFSGPLPPPEIMQKYEQTLPGAADRIMTMAEDQGHHRRELEKAVIDSDIANSHRGSIFGFIIAITVVLAGTILIGLDKDASGLGILITGLATLTGVFVYANKSRKKERIKKYGENVD
jgi:uncharacterized membrane protein